MDKLIIKTFFFGQRRYVYSKGLVLYDLSYIAGSFIFLSLQCNGRCGFLNDRQMEILVLEFRQIIKINIKRNLSWL